MNYLQNFERAILVLERIADALEKNLSLQNRNESPAYIVNIPGKPDEAKFRSVLEEIRRDNIGTTEHDT